MNDRELLEMAAKAAGYGGAWIKWPGACNPLDTELGFFHGSDGSVWSPLTNDGDALRLAVKLHMACSFEESGTFVEARDGFGACAEKHDYRRAIVRAAAEIGRAMP